VKGSQLAETERAFMVYRDRTPGLNNPPGLNKPPVDPLAKETEETQTLKNECDSLDHKKAMAAHLSTPPSLNPTKGKYQGMGATVSPPMVVPREGKYLLLPPPTLLNHSPSALSIP